MSDCRVVGLSNRQTVDTHQLGMRDWGWRLTVNVDKFVRVQHQIWTHNRDPPPPLSLSLSVSHTVTPTFTHTVHSQLVTTHKNNND